MYPYQNVGPKSNKVHHAGLLAETLANYSRDNLPVLYLSGPMSGLPRCNFPAFNEAARRLRHLGFPVLNPADFGGERDDTPYKTCLSRDLALIPHAAIVVLLDGWAASHGAGVEIDVAIGLKIPLVMQGDLHAKVLSHLFSENELFALDMLDRDRQDLAVGYDGTGRCIVGEKATINRIARVARAANILATALGANYDVPEVDEDDEDDDDDE
jgi:hypothetical protein